MTSRSPSRSTDADHPFLGGYVGLATTDMAGGFYGLSTSDNVPGPRRSCWKIAAGSWLQQDSGYVHSSLSDSGQLNLLDSGGLTGAFVPRPAGHRHLRRDHRSRPG